MHLRKPIQAITFLDKNGTRRIGSHINNLHGIIDQIGSDYYIYSPDTVKFYGNERTTTHENIGNYSIKVCFTNLEMFKTSYWGDNGYGANNETEFNKQRTKFLLHLMPLMQIFMPFVKFSRDQWLCKIWLTD